MLRELRNIILLRDWRKPTGRAEWFVVVLGGVIALIGTILALGGAQLVAVGGSWYYLFAGLALIVAGLAVAQRKLLGAWIYAGAFAVTVLWAFWEVGLNGWALVPRLVGPLVLLLLVILSLPVMDANRERRRMLFGLGGFALIVIALGVAVAQANRPDSPGATRKPWRTPRLCKSAPIGPPTAGPTTRSVTRRSIRSIERTCADSNAHGPSAPATCRRSAGVRKRRRS